MSFWTDIRDTITAPFSAVGSLVSDIASGKNVFESVGKEGFKALASFQAPEDLFNKYTGLDNVLEKASPYTFNITGRLAEQSKLRYDVVTGDKEISGSEAATYWKGTAANAAVGAATYFGGVTGGLAAAGALSFVDSKKGFGDIALGFGAAAGGAGLGSAIGDKIDGLSEYTDYFNQAKSAAETASSLYSKFRSQLPVQQSGYPTSTTPGAESDFTDSDFITGYSQKNNLMLVLGLMGAAAFLVVRKKHG